MVVRLMASAVSQRSHTAIGRRRPSSTRSGRPDNLAAHKRAVVGIAIEAAGAWLLYLPPYSPDLNPIEMAFAKFKAALRKAAARSIETLVDAIAAALVAFTAQECLNFFSATGYDRA